MNCGEGESLLLGSSSSSYEEAILSFIETISYVHMLRRSSHNPANLHIIFLLFFKRTLWYMDLPVNKGSNDIPYFLRFLFSFDLFIKKDKRAFFLRRFNILVSASCGSLSLHKCWTLSEILIGWREIYINLNDNNILIWQ